jgi:pimeloyl-ACP methyl ester carboxylesterase
MKRVLKQRVSALILCLSAVTGAAGAPAINVLGQDYTFAQPVAGLPVKLSDFRDLEINRFTTSDGVQLAYWAAGKGKPLVFVPGWSSSGAEFVNVLYLLRQHYRVYVLDPRNQGLSQHVEYGGRIARFATDLKEFSDHLGLASADYCGWSMGAAILWSRIDLFGTQGMRKLVFVDEPISIYAHADWSEKERLEAGGMTSSIEHMVASFTTGAPVHSLVVDMKAMERFAVQDSPAFVNSLGFANTFIRNDPKALARVLFDHASNDWRDVIRHKIRVPTAIFSGEQSNNLPSQRWMQQQIPGSILYIYSTAEHGDHFLMAKNPVKFAQDLRDFLER